MISLLEKIKNNYLILLVAGIAFILGGLLMKPTIQDESHIQEAAVVKTWTCSMHPNINLPEFGQCPICFMDLIPLIESGVGLTNSQLAMSKEAIQLANIQTVEVMSAVPTKEVHLSGKIDYDETRIGTITAWVPGRLERMFVDYTGIRVQKGDHMMKLYSPDLYAAQEELIQAKRLYQTMNGSENIMKQSAGISLNAAREKLNLMGLSQNQITEIELKKSPSPIVEMKSPMSGIVIEKNGVEGAYVKTGTPIYTIADLSHVWVLFDAYESDLPWIALGQTVVFNTESNPGKSYQGKIAFIEPIVSEKTRTVQVRVNINNVNGELKPGMFTHGIIQSKISPKGKALNTELEGKWVCPMHPEIIKDKESNCTTCGMPLESAESLGIVHSGEDHNESLLIPSSSVLKTGHQAIVYVMTLHGDEPIFESRTVELGARVGNNYIVKSGVSLGELVVLNGNFKIDSAMQIAGKTSMMNSGDKIDKINNNNSKDKKYKVNNEVNTIVNSLLDYYFDLQQSLGNDQLDKSRLIIQNMNNHLQSNTSVPTGLKGESAFIWKKSIATLTNATTINENQNIESIRLNFKTITDIFLFWDEFFDFHYHKSVYKVFCPMAFNDTGGTWLSQESAVFNPYFGAMMLRCGTIQGQIN